MTDTTMTEPLLEVDARRRRAALEMLLNLATANNQAVLDILHGDNLQAFRGIRQAAGEASRLAQPLIRECEASLSNSQSHDFPDAAGTTAAAIADNNKLHVHPIYAAQVWSIGGDNDSKECFVFSSPFQILRNFSAQQLSKTATLRYMKAVSAVAIFNMALSCHLQHGIADTVLKQEVLASRAVALYSQAATLLDECQMQPSESVHLVYLALCKNLVEVCLSQGRLHQAQCWKERLGEAIQRACDNLPYHDATSTTTALLHYFKDTQVIYCGTFGAARAA